MKEYSTRQRTLLTDYLKQYANRDFSADELVQALADCGVNRSTVYRNLNKLVQENVVVQKVAPDGSRKVYRYNAARGCSGHLHLICLKCGRVVHTAHMLTEGIAGALLRECGFALSADHTTIEGLCEACKNG